MPADHVPNLTEALDFYAPQDRARIGAAFRACTETGESFDEVCQLVTAKCNHKWVRALGSAVRDVAGRITGVQVAIQDITQLHRAEGSIAQSP